MELLPLVFTYEIYKKMTPKPTGRPRITAEDFAKRKIEIARIKAEAEEKNKQRTYEKSAFFRGPAGKILWVLSLLIIIFCSIVIIDGWLGTKYSKLEIKSSYEDKVGLIKGGYLVSSTFNWAFLDDQEKLGIHMHHDQFDLMKEEGLIYLGTSPILNIPKEFTVKNNDGNNELHTLGQDYAYIFFIPFFLIILSVLWLFAKPKKSMQWIMFGYINLVVSPILLILLIVQVISYLNGVGLYEINTIDLS